MLYEVCMTCLILALPVDFRQSVGSHGRQPVDRGAGPEPLPAHHRPRHHSSRTGKSGAPDDELVVVPEAHGRLSGGADQELQDAEAGGYQQLRQVLSKASRGAARGQFAYRGVVGEHEKVRGAKEARSQAG